MAIIDAQVHAYERDHPGRPWHNVLHGPPQVTGDDMVAAMDAVGVDGALLVSPYTLYQFDPSYAAEVGAAHPGKFGLIAPMNTRGEDIPGAVAAWLATPGAVGVRVMMWGEVGRTGEDPGVAAVLTAAAAHGVPVTMLGWGRLPVVDQFAAAHPNTQIVVDHLGLQQPFEPPRPAEPFADLDHLLALARHPNVAVKITGACTLSHEPFPFGDLWGPLEQIFAAFGLDRCLWGTDWTRATALVSYADAVAAFTETERLSDSDRAQLMGGSLERIFAWSPN